MKIKAQKVFKTILSIGAGAGTVFGGAYVISRLQEKQETEKRLERMEQILEEIREGKKEE